MQLHTHLHAIYGSLKLPPNLSKSSIYKLWPQCWDSGTDTLGSNSSCYGNISSSTSATSEAKSLLFNLVLHTSRANGDRGTLWVNQMVAA